MSLISFLGKTVVGITAATAAITLAPVLGVVGTISVAGTFVAAVAGVGAAAYDEYNK